MLVLPNRRTNGRWSLAYYGLLLAIFLLCLFNQPATARSIKMFEDNTASFDSSVEKEQQLVRRLAPSMSTFCYFHPEVCQKAKESAGEAADM